MESIMYSLDISEPYGSVAPRITYISSRLTAEVGSRAHIACIGQGYPQIQYSWSKNDQLFPPRGVSNTRIFEDENGVLSFEHITIEDNGKYVCLLNNSIGKEIAEMELIVRIPISISIIPPFQVSKTGQSVLFNCSVSGHPIQSVTWIKDGKSLYGSSIHHEINKTVLKIRKVDREDAGMYQCIVRNHFETVQATASLVHGGHYTYK